MGNDDTSKLDYSGASSEPSTQPADDAQAADQHQQNQADGARGGFRSFPDLPTVLKRPLLVGGLGLSATLALLGSAHINPLDSSTLLSAIALGSGIWWWRRGDRPPAAPKPIAPPVVDRSRAEAELADLAVLINTLGQESALVNGSALSLAVLQASLEGYRREHQALGQGLERQELQVAIAGDPRTGKTAILALLEEVMADQALTFVEVSLAPAAAPDWLGYDGVLLITDGDLTNSAFTLLRDRVMAGQGTVLVFNKQDLYDPADQQTIVSQLEQRVAALPATVLLVGTAACPRPIKVRRHQADGRVIETMETPEPAIAGLQSALESAVVAERSTLVAATVLRQTQTLRQRVQTDLNRLR
ncbi:MAG: GTPase domain-containing protein, partial [Nodosilinea sp.]